MTGMVVRAVSLGLGIQGWKTPEELAWLAQEASRAKRILDIGCWRGQTPKVMAAASIAHITAVDHLTNFYTGEWGRNEILRQTQQDAIHRECRENLKAELIEGRVRLVFADGQGARDVVRELAGDERFDFVWLDGDHAYEDVKADILAYRALLAPGGLLAGHDFDPSFPGVPLAVRELCPGYSLGAGSAWYIRV